MATESVEASRLIRGAGEMHRWSDRRRLAGERIGLVPTMGYLHEGHLSLVDRARGAADLVVMSIFVNPAQFGPDEDLERYPRDLESDLRLASDRGVDVVFAPSVADMYPREQTIWVEPGPLGERLCGASRPGHFRGVLTVVLKLFEIVRPDVAVFGRKDYQQAFLIRRMVEELAVPVEVDVAPIVRESDGLAMSSRNAYLDPLARDQALSLTRAVAAIREAYAAGETSSASLISRGRELLDAGGARVDYLEIVGAEDLEPVEWASADSVCLVAAWVGATRLIDNARLGE